MRRALRIFPLYYGALFIILCATSILGEPRNGLMGTPADRAWLWTYRTNILMTVRHNWTYSSLNHFWSLAVEEHFYLVWPFLVIAMRMKPLLWLCVASVPVSLLIRSVFVYPLHNEIAAYVLTICRVDSLLVGCLIAIAAHISDLKRLAKPAKAIALSMAVIIPAFVCCVTHASNTDRIVGPTIFGLFFGALLVLTLTQPKLSNVFQNRTLSVLGKYSYGIYVYHFIIIVGLEQVWNWTAMPPVLNYFVFFAIASSLSFVIAVMSYQLYEVHFLKLKRYFQA